MTQQVSIDLFRWLLVTRCPSMSDAAKITLNEIVLRRLSGDQRFPTLAELQAARQKSRSNIKRHLDELKAIGVLVEVEVDGKTKRQLDFKALYDLMGVPDNQRAKLRKGDPKAATKLFTAIIEDDTYARKIIRAQSTGKKSNVKKVGRDAALSKFLSKKVKDYTATDMCRYFQLKLEELHEVSVLVDTRRHVHDLRQLHEKYGSRLIVNSMDWFLEHFEVLDHVTHPSLGAFCKYFEEIQYARKGKTKKSKGVVATDDLETSEVKAAKARLSKKKRVNRKASKNVGTRL